MLSLSATSPESFPSPRRSPGNTCICCCAVAVPLSVSSFADPSGVPLHSSTASGTTSMAAAAPPRSPQSAFILLHPHDRNGQTAGSVPRPRKRRPRRGAASPPLRGRGGRLCKPPVRGAEHSGSASPEFVPLPPVYASTAQKIRRGDRSLRREGKIPYSVFIVNSICKIAESIAASSSFSTVAHAPL